MRYGIVVFLSFIFLGLLLAACTAGEPSVTRVVEEVPVTVVVQREIEVTREVPVIEKVEVTRVVEVTRLIERVVAATPEPSSTAPLPGDTIALNYVAQAESGGLEIGVARVLVGWKDEVSSALGNDFDSVSAFQDVQIVAELIFTMTNNTEQTLNVYPDQASVQVGSEQIDVFEYILSSSFGDDLGGEIHPGVTKIGGYWFGIKRSELPDISGMTIRFSGPRGENFGTLGPDFEIVVDLTDRRFEEIPEELR